MEHGTWIQLRQPNFDATTIDRRFRKFVVFVD